MAETGLSVTFRGPRVDAGRMQVRTLAPALLALADLIHDAQQDVYAGDPPLTVDIDAVEAGSFRVVLAMVHDAAVHVLTSDTTSASANLVGLAQGVLLAFDLWRRIGRREIEAVEPVGEGQTRIRLADATEITAPTPAVRMVRSVRRREYARGVVEPLREEEITEVEFAVVDRDPVTIGREDAGAFAVGDPDEDGVREYRTVMPMTISSLSFKRGNKWRLHDGSTTYWVRIEDDAFLDRVETNSEDFRKDDQLVVELVTRQFIRDGQLVNAEHVVRSVMSHVPVDPDRQIPLMSQPSLPPSTRSGRAHPPSLGDSTN